MGCGKSTVGPELAKLLGRKFVDIDELIVKAKNKSISEIFKTEGEDSFRYYEKDVIKTIAKDSYQVVSLGGGALEDPANLRCVLESGKLVYLQCTPETLLKRLKNEKEKRPLLLENNDLNHTVIELLEKRSKTYQQAQFHFVADDLSPDKLAFEIYKKAY